MRLVRPAQGMSVFKSSERVTSVAVGDEAKVVPETENKEFDDYGPIHTIQIQQTSRFSLVSVVILFVFKSARTFGS